jgi:hypothetical protein
VRLSRGMRPFVFVSIAALARGVAGAAVSDQSPSARVISELNAFEKCGVERWKVKTLQDRPNLLAPQERTIAYLVTRTKPSPLPGTRAPFERHQFIVTAAVTKKLAEDDGDFHLVLDDGKERTRRTLRRSMDSSSSRASVPTRSGWASLSSTGECGSRRKS